jgi:hypothetical protein
MARSSLRDPLSKLAWSMSIPGFSRVAFSSCQMPALEITTKEYEEGGQHWAPKNIPDKFSYKPIVLARGVTNDPSFNKWATGVVDLYTSGNSQKNSEPTLLSNPLAAIADFATSAVSGGAPSMRAVPSGIDASEASTAQYRKDIRIDHLNRAGQVEVSYFIYGAYPIRYQPGSDFDAMGDDTLSIETLTLGYDSFEVKYAGITGFAGNIIADRFI